MEQTRFVKYSHTNFDLYMWFNLTLSML